MDASAPIEQLLPHAPPMVLLDSITEHSDTHITCQSQSHLAADNPLRCQGMLSVYAGIEYAAQAMAIHARLSRPNTGSSAPRKGVVAVASRLEASTEYLDDCRQPLIIRADIIAQTDDSTLCSFQITAGEQVLLQGQLTALMTT